MVTKELGLFARPRGILESFSCGVAVVLGAALHLSVGLVGLGLLTVVLGGAAAFYLAS